MLDQIAKANKNSIAHYWERCPSGFMCKICNMHYKVLKNVRYLSKFTCIFIHTNSRFANTDSSRGENEMNIFLRHRKENLYKCKLCDRSYHCRGNFKTHTESHEEFHLIYVCGMCKKGFNLQFQYWEHVIRSHSIGYA